MKRHKKRKIKKNITLVTVLLLVLFGTFLIKEKFSNASLHDENDQTEIEEPNNNEEPIEPKEPEETEEEETSIEPEKEPDETGQEGEVEDPVEVQEDGIVIENPEKLDVLVNKKRNLPDTYKPEDLVTLSELPTVLENPEVNQLRSPAYEALKDLFQAAKDEEGYELYARSGYRSYNTQASLYSSYVNSYGREAADKYSAKPGQSEHQTGLSIDITCQAMNFRLDDTFGQTDEGKWVAENAHRFGYIIRYPEGKEDITGYLYEPWHIRYLGVELAEKVYSSGLTLEEYFEMP
jgi:D-alanyl-D-alanine carboxypeptidase